MGKFCLLRHRNRWGKKKKERGRNWPHATLKGGKSLCFVGAVSLFEKRRRRKGLGVGVDLPPSTLAIWFDGSPCHWVFGWVFGWRN